MLRHIAMFRFAPDTTPEQIEHMADGLRSLPGQVPEVRSFTIGRDLGLREGNWDYAVVADFADIEAWKVYAADAVHQQVIAERITPIITERTSVQFEW
ncbi:MAG: Dabb family protein [Acidimicrobiales bacterium]